MGKSKPWLKKIIMGQSANATGCSVKQGSPTNNCNRFKVYLMGLRFYKRMNTGPKFSRNVCTTTVLGSFTIYLGMQWKITTRVENKISSRMYHIFSILQNSYLFCQFKFISILEITFHLGYFHHFVVNLRHFGICFFSEYSNSD